jgi:hypothetical protein
MRTTIFTQAQLIEKYRIWLKKHVKKNGELFKSIPSYLNLLQKAVMDLNFRRTNDFFYILQEESLQRLFESLKSSGSFKNRDSKEQSDIISGYKKYLLFVSESF